MNIIAIVPLRSLHDGKRRLSGVLSSLEREDLIKRLFLRTQRAITAANCVDHLYVVSPDSALLDWIKQFGARPVFQEGGGLNEGLEQARRVLMRQYGEAALLVILPDLPLITPSDITALAQRGAQHNVVLAPDRHGRGTNALLLQSADAVPFRFGTDSLHHHLSEAETRQLSVWQYHAPGTAFDLDSADDLERYAEHEISPGPGLGLRLEALGKC